MGDNPSANFVIGIPTYKRPEGLSRLLDSLSGLKMLPDVTVQIVVADNEGDGGQGMGVVTRLIEGGKYPHRIRAVGVSDRGVAAVRNRLLQESFGVDGADYLAMVDDDEWVEPEWLSSLINTQRQTQADVVWGHVIPDFNGYTIPWAKDLRIYYRRAYPEGVIPDLCGTTSVLIAKSLPCGKDGKEHHVFDMDFSMTGGEDMEFFTRLRKIKGFQGAFAPRAISHEVFPVSRMNKKWALQRYFRIGTTDMRILKKHHLLSSPQSICLELVRIVVAILQGSLLSMIFFWDEGRQMVGLTRVFRQFGKISGLLGHYKSEYKVIHGK